MKSLKRIYMLAFTTALLLMQCSSFMLSAQTAAANTPLVERYIAGYNDINKMKFVYDSVLYAEGWHTLPQPIFWQQVMTLSSDSAIVSLASTRQMLDRVAVKDWSVLTETQKSMYKDSIRKAYGIMDSSTVFITAGKKDFYQLKKVLPTISRSIAVFKDNNVDPWYAQAILLIESPGKVNTKSTVGANGPFQLMKAVAKKEGLIVNGVIDERTDIEKSALGASRLLSRICIPYVRTILDSAHLQYNETDLWFRLLVLHAYHAGAGNVAGVIRKINPCEGGMPLMQTVWQTTYGGFKNASQNYSQLALAAFCNFNDLVIHQSQNDTVYLIDGDRMLNSYVKNTCDCDDRCTYLGHCISKYENDLVDGTIPFDYFVEKTKVVENELSGISPYAYNLENYNNVGYKLLKAKKVEEAFKVFKLNASSNPDSWTAYHGLGESYRLMGQKELALSNFKKSLELNPNNADTLKAITRLTSK